MNFCDVYIENDENNYEGQYECEDGQLIVEIHDYISPQSDSVKIGEFVKNKSIKIMDVRNHKYYYSTVFINIGTTYSDKCYERYSTKCYLYTGIADNVEEYKEDMNVEKIRIYHPALNQCFSDETLKITRTESYAKYEVNYNVENKIVEIGSNGIKAIEFGVNCIQSQKNDNRIISIESDFFAVINLQSEVLVENVLGYVYEFDVFLNAFCHCGMRSYRTIITTKNGKSFEVFNESLGKEKYYKSTIHAVVKMPFFEYISKIYRVANYRDTYEKNKFIPLDFRKPFSLEEQYTFYFRCIDLYMGEYLPKNDKKKVSNFDRMSVFVDENIDLFKKEDVGEIQNFKNELNSLRNQYIHEGYFLSDGQFEVKRFDVFLYKKRLDYSWLLRIVGAFRFGVFRILYKRILDIEINESELRAALNCW